MGCQYVSRIVLVHLNDYTYIWKTYEKLERYDADDKQALGWALDKKASIWRLPKGLMKGLARVGGWLHLPLNPERLRKLTEDYISSNAKIKEALGIERMPVDAREGLRRTIESFR